MASRFIDGLKRFVMWDFPRASWQYDVMVGLILAFIFLTPRHWFRDQPRPSSVVMLEADARTRVFWIEAELLADEPASLRDAAAAALLHKRFGGNFTLVRVEPIFDAESEVKGYMAVVKP
jgi:hypothetical protein